MESNSVFISRYHRKPKFICFMLIRVKNEARTVLRAKFCRSSRDSVVRQLHHFSFFCQRTTSFPCNRTVSPAILNCWNSRSNAPVDNRTYVDTLLLLKRPIIIITRILKVQTSSNTIIYYFSSATCFHRNRSSSGVLYKTSRSKVKRCYLWDLSYVTKCDVFLTVHHSIDLFQ